MPILLFAYFFIGLVGKTSSDKPTSVPPSSEYRADSGSLEDVALNCSHVRHLLSIKNLKQLSIMPDKPIQGFELRMCSATRSCCNKEMEESFITAVSSDFRLTVQRSSSSLKSLLKTTSTRLQGYFLDLIRWAENNTQSLFAQIYNIMEPDVQIVTGQLYSSLKDFLQGKDIDLKIQLSQYFSSIFPHVYRHVINNNLVDFGDEFTNCLRKVQSDIKPFGARQKSLSLRIVKSFHDVRTFLQVLSLGIEFINTIDRQEFGGECKKALVRMTYCSHCFGLTGFKPCSSYCLNVARGCLAQIADLDHPWNEFVTGLEVIVSEMITDYNIEKLLNIMDVKISESVMYAMEQGGEIVAQVQRRCNDGQHPKLSARPTSVVSFQDAANTEAATTNFKPILSQQLQTFVQNLADFKSYYGNLADSVCNNSPWSSVKDIDCWNGSDIGEYRKTIAGSGVGAQKYNPEVIIGTKQNLMVTPLVNKLVHMRRLLDLRITRAPVAESLVVPEVGSGVDNINWKEGGIQDDEDYYYYESGSGYLWGMSDRDYNYFFFPSGSGNLDLFHTEPSLLPTTEDTVGGSTRTESDIHFDKEVETPIQGKPQDGRDSVANGMQNNVILLVSAVLIIIMNFVA